MSVMIRKATRTKCKASIQLQGLSGRGKTGAALTIAAALSSTNNFDTTLFVDTESGAVDLFDGLVLASGVKVTNLDCAPMDKVDGFNPGQYTARREEAKRLGKEIIIYDSITHAWNREDGILDIVSRLKETDARFKRDSYAAWGAPEVMKAKQELFEMVRDQNLHVINTVRVKERMEYEDDASTGKKKLVSMGEQQIMQADMKYEFDLVLTCLAQGTTKAGKKTHPRVRVEKSRYQIFVEGEEYELTPEVLKNLREYLDSGLDPLELEEAQRQDYLKLLGERFKTDPTDKTIADITKENLGYPDSKYKDLPFHVLKQIYVTLFK